MWCGTVLFAACALFAGAVRGADVGDRLTRTYTEYVPMPVNVSEALAHGWVQVNDSCTPGLGVPYRLQKSKVETTILYFSKGSGKVSGVSIDAYGTAPPTNVVQRGYYNEVAHDRYRMSLGYRAPAGVCNESVKADNHTIGDRVVINPMGLAQSLPMTVDVAEAQGWHKGACFKGMGHHYFYDLVGRSNMTWTAENLLPLSVMFNNDGLLQATFFATWTIQEHFFKSVDWEPVPLTNGLFCKNFCDDSTCHFSGTHFWSTYHIYYRNLDRATCDGDCRIHCCP